MPLKAVLDRVFSTKTIRTTDVVKSSVVPSSPNGTRKPISRVETAAVLRGILGDEQLNPAKPRAHEDLIQ